MSPQYDQWLEKTGSAVETELIFSLYCTKKALSQALFPYAFELFLLSGGQN